MDRSTCPKTGSSTALGSVINTLSSGFVALPFTLLTIAVVFFALFLGLMVGWSGGRRDVQKTLSAPPEYLWSNVETIPSTMYLYMSRPRQIGKRKDGPNYTPGWRASHL